MVAASIIGIITVLGSLVLVVSNFRSHGLSLERTAKMALAWLVIILGLFLVVSWIGA